MTDFNYKEYSLDNLKNWVSDAVLSSEASPQEIYETIKKTVQEEYYYFKHHCSRAYELLCLLNGNGENITDKIQPVSPVSKVCAGDDSSDYCKQSWNDFWWDSTNSSLFSEDIVKVDESDEYSIREEEYYNKRDKSDYSPNKWILPIEIDDVSGDYFVTLPNDLLDKLQWTEDDILEYVDNKDGSFILKKIKK